MLTLFILAPVIGSFLGVLVHRLPRGQQVVTGRSRCDACGHVLGPLELVPLASFIALGGRCRHCRTPIDRMHPAIELASLGVALVVAATVGDDPARLAAGSVLGWTLLALGWIDWLHLRLPDVLTLPLILLGLGATALLEPDALADHALAAMGGYLAFAAVAALYRWRRGRDGLGGGDAKLMAAAGAWLGVAGLAPVMGGGAVLGLGLAGLGHLLGQGIARDTRIPFGSCLALAIGVVWCVQAAAG